eukprot:EG_transcript_6946
MKPHRKAARREATASPRCSLDPPPDFLLELVFGYLGLPFVQVLCLLSSEWHRATHRLLHCTAALDLRFRSPTPRTMVFLVGLAQQVMAVTKLSIAGDRWEEKQAGVLGLLLLKSPGLRVIEFTGSLHYSVLREVVKYCQHLERLWKTDRPDPAPSGGGCEVPLDAALLGPLLAGCPRLAELRLGGVRFTRPPVPAKPEALPPLSHAALRVLHIENVGCVAPAARSRFACCAFPQLRELCVSEHPHAIPSGVVLPFRDILHIIHQSPQLERLEISAPCAFSRADCERIAHSVPRLQCLRLRPYTAAFLQHSEPRLPDAALDVLLTRLPSLESISIESVGWEEHWDSYRSLQEPFLLLQYPFPSLTILASNIARFSRLQACVLFGEVTNKFVHTLLGTCFGLRRLELYFLGRGTEVDDTLFSVVPPTDPYPSLEWLHLHVWKHASHGPIHTLTSAVLKDLQHKFPNLHKLAVLGLKDADSAVCQAVALEATHIKHLVIGPILSTTSELLNIVGSLPTLQQLDLCWDGGSLPTSDETFDIALGTHTLWSIIRQINPNVVVRDVGGAGHFYPL